MRLGKIGTQNIESGEHPATAGTVLIVYTLRGSLQAKVGIYGALTFKILRQVVNVI